MNARALLFLLIITMLLALTRRYRRVGVSLGVVLVALIFWQTLSSVSGPAPAVTDAPKNSSGLSAVVIPLDSLSLSHMELKGTGAPWHLSGEVTNSGSVAVNAVKLLLIRRSCSSATTDSGECKILWQGEHTLRVSLPAGASQSFEESVWSHTPVATPAGVIRDSFQIVEIIAQTSPAS